MKYKNLNGEPMSLRCCRCCFAVVVVVVIFLLLLPEMQFLNYLFSFHKIFTLHFSTFVTCVRAKNNYVECPRGDLLIYFHVHFIFKKEIKFIFINNSIHQIRKLMNIIKILYDTNIFFSYNFMLFHYYLFGSFFFVHFNN